MEILAFPSAFFFWLLQPEADVLVESRKDTLALLMAPNPACYLSPAGIFECEMSETLSLRKVLFAVCASVLLDSKGLDWFSCCLRMSVYA